MSGIQALSKKIPTALEAEWLDLSEKWKRTLLMVVVCPILGKIIEVIEACNSICLCVFADVEIRIVIT